MFVLIQKGMEEGKYDSLKSTLSSSVGYEKGKPIAEPERIPLPVVEEKIEEVPFAVCFLIRLFETFSCG